MPPRLRQAVLLPLVLVLAGCGTFLTPEPDAAPLAPGGQRAAVYVDSNPPGAAIAVNERVLGPAPTTVQVEVDRNGDLVDDLRLAADFSTSQGAAGGGVVTQEFVRGQKPPSVVNFTTQDASFRNR